MGHAKQKLTEDAKEVTFDFAAPDLMILDGDQANLEKNPDGTSTPGTAVPRATRIIMQTIVMAAYPQGMGRHDGKIWSAWLDCLEVDERPKATVTMGMVTWLLKHVVNEDLKIPIGMVQWREALADYLAALKAVETEKSIEEPTES